MKKVVTKKKVLVPKKRPTVVISPEGITEPSAETEGTPG
jgi:hypothetical protein